MKQSAARKRNDAVGQVRGSTDEDGLGLIAFMSSVLAIVSAVFMVLVWIAPVPLESLYPVVQRTLRASGLVLALTAVVLGAITVLSKGLQKAFLAPFAIVLGVFAVLFFILSQIHFLPF